MQDDTALTYSAAESVALEHTPQIGELVTALAKAQAEMANADFDSKNYYGKGYASMAAVRNATVPSLASHGIAITQHPQIGPGWVRCTTVLWCGEQYLKSTTQCKVVKTRKSSAGEQVIPVGELNHQDYVGAFSYLRRISLQAVCNIAGEEDDDGEQAVGRGGQPGSRKAEEDTERRALAQRQKVEEAAAARVEALRQELLREIHDVYKEAIVPLKHAGMHKAIFFHAFHLEKPEQIKQLAVETLEAGMPLYQHLTAHLLTWDRKSQEPDAWIAEQVRQLAAGDAPDVPDGVDPATGEDHREMPDDWMTDDERREQAARDEAARLEQANA